MGFIRRCGVLLRGFFSLFVGNIEERNPDILFEDISSRIQKVRKEAEEQIIEIQTNAEMMKLEMKNTEKKLDTVRSRIEAAAQRKDKELLIELLIREEELENACEENKSAYSNALSEVERIKSDYRVFEADMNARIEELKSLKSQAKIASLREKINSINAGYAGTNTNLEQLSRCMERARELVSRKAAQARAISSLGDANIELKIARLDLNCARERAQAKAQHLLGEKAE
ncbi:MAG: PspA/IM30 family protein [Acetivibrionales bacterium]|jgi:phage shock protein A